MENIQTILEKFGIEIPEEKQAEFLKSVNENYKTIVEFQNQSSKLENITTQFNTAKESLAKFDGVDVDAFKTQVSELRSKLNEQETAHATKLEEMEYMRILENKLNAEKFSSSYARKGILEEIKSKGLKRDGDNILGFDDYMKSLKETNVEAFATETNKATVTIPPTGATNPTAKAEAKTNSLWGLPEK